MFCSTILLVSIVAATDIAPQRVSNGSIFQLFGRVEPGLMYGHLHVPIRLSVIRQRKVQLQQLSEMINEVPTDALEDSSKSKIRWIQRWISGTINTTAVLVDDTLDSYIHHDLKSHRAPRQIIAATVGLIIGGFATYAATSVHKQMLIDVLEQKQDVIAHTVDHNLVQLAQHDHDIHLLNTTLGDVQAEFKKILKGSKTIRTRTMLVQTSFAVQGTTSQITHLLEGLVDARRGKFTTSLTSTQELKNALRQLQRQAIRSGRSISISSILRLADMPCSTVVDPVNEVIHVIAHIPFTDQHSLLHLYRYVGLPAFHQGFGADESPWYSETTSDDHYLAITQDSTKYQLYKQEELDRCHKMEEVYYCGDALFFKASKGSCLWGLYTNNAEMVTAHCHVTVTRDVSQVTRINSTSILISESKSTDVSILCKDRKLRSNIQGSYIFHLDRGCTISTPSFTMTRPIADNEVTVDGLLIPDPITFDDPSQDDDDFLHTMDTMLGQVGRKVSLQQMKQVAQYRRELRAASRANIGKAILEMLPASMTGTIITIVVILSVLLVARIVWGITSCTCKKPVPSSDPEDYDRTELQPMVDNQPARPGSAATTSHHSLESNPSLHPHVRLVP